MADRSGFYYLHTEGALIFKSYDTHRERDLIESDFVKCYWPFEQGHRSHCWRIIVEGEAAGVNQERLRVLADMWGCNDTDAKVFAAYVGADLKHESGGGIFEQWIASVPDSHQRVRGEGATAVAALVSLCRALGWKPVKRGPSFEELVKAA